MSNPNRIAVMYSYGPHFIPAIRLLRQQYPDSRLTALIPPAFPQEPIASLVDEILVSVPEPGAHRSLPDMYRLLHSIRGGRYDMLVLLFDSLKLRMIASASNAATVYCFTVDGRLAPLTTPLYRSLLDTSWRVLYGHILYYKIWWHIRLHPIRSEKKK